MCTVVIEVLYCVKVNNYCSYCFHDQSLMSYLSTRTPDCFENSSTDDTNFFNLIVKKNNRVLFCIIKLQ